jgi:hypothetical protein
MNIRYSITRDAKRGAVCVVRECVCGETSVSRIIVASYRHKHTARVLIDGLEKNLDILEKAPRPLPFSHVLGDLLRIPDDAKKFCGLRPDDIRHGSIIHRGYGCWSRVGLRKSRVCEINLCLVFYGNSLLGEFICSRDETFTCGGRVWSQPWQAIDAVIRAAYPHALKQEEQEVA